jgi:hypothetical protein
MPVFCDVVTDGEGLDSAATQDLDVAIFDLGRRLGAFAVPKRSR